MSFHDTSRGGGRVPVMADYFGFTLGALSEKGTVYASQIAAGRAQSMLMFKPFHRCVVLPHARRHVFTIPCRRCSGHSGTPGGLY
jgi:hypothetical protein